MKTLPVFDPFVEFDRFFQGFVPVSSRTANTAEGHTVPMDVFEKDGKWTLRASLPGVKPEDIDVQIENKVLTLRGQLSFEEEHEDAKVYRREISSGTFVRSVRLPADVDVENVSATFANGFVTVTLPRVIEEKPAAIKVPVKALEPSKN